MFKTKTITIWIITYDNDPNQVYVMTSFDKMMSAVHGSIHEYIDDPEKCCKINEIMEEIITEDGVFIPIKINDLCIKIQKLELDYSNKIHKILSDCHTQVDDKLRHEIESLFA